MDDKLRPVWAEVNLDNAAHNMKEIRRISSSKDIIAVIKADAYGHGAIEMAQVFVENGATRLAVAVITEAIELRKAGITAPIMILGFTPAYYAEELIKYDIEVTAFSYDYVEELSKEAEKFNETVKIHIALDTGMGRIGFLIEDKSVEDVYKITQLTNITIEGIFSHFSTADELDKEYTYLQFKKFDLFLNKLEQLGIKIKIKHISNSGAIIDLQDYNLDAVRPGIILYGYYPSDEVKRENISLKPVMTVKAKIINIKKLPAHEYISYGRKYITSKETIVATLPIGYADGYTRLLFGKAKVIINGKFAPVIGRICMDMCMIDVTDIPGAKVGDEVIILGEENGIKYDADDIAKDLGTINYEVICAVSKRVPRVFIKEGKTIEVRNYI
ncbi:alanine racemase [Clostridium sp. 19966]|uniref:alanine racemase n=1 Tax=Clostridium sp. 19966 TaxID=2768166 RepID=UPI0028DE3288|nr:alanine racemase [Clostridium sp. 19966]MDT8716109.1 alanine racemase [Clostridium sp. 19966]